MPAPFLGRTLLVVGLAREGGVAARWLAEHGARVIVSDVKDAESLAPLLAELQPLGVEARLGPQTPNLLIGIDALVVSPGIQQDHPLLIAARERSLPVTSETRLFAQHCPAPMVGITGSSGKTTTTTLTAKMLEAAGRRVWLGGNIGVPQLAHVEQMRADDRAVLELSSFQLLYWAEQPAAQSDGMPWTDTRGTSPNVAAILNLTPNHLDRHPSMAHYAAAKAQILAHQTADGIAVLNRDDAFTGGWASSGWVDIAAGSGQQAVRFPVRSRIVTFGLNAPLPVGHDGAWMENGHLHLRWQAREYDILPVSALKLRGAHNLANGLAASCLAAAGGAIAAGGIESLAETLRTFGGVPHRLEEVRVRNDVLWVNDSIATSPERSLAALRSFDPPLILLAGGRDKHLPWQEWAAYVHERVRYVVTFGEAAALIAEALREAAPADGAGCEVRAGGDLAGAVALAAKLAQPGDVVLLSPGGTSYDSYIDFAERGQHFRELVNALP